MINLPPILGNINRVPLSSYKEIIENYIYKVSKLNDVLSIVQIGSFTSPGISDIDMIVVIKDGANFPNWNDISLKNISKNHKDADVIAHDIFVIPEYVAQNAEAYFYIDQQIVLKGDQLGRQLSSDLANKCKEFLALEYAVFSLESIANMLLSSTIKLRNIILLISTMRHSANIAFDLKLINKEKKIALIQEIEKLRSDVLSKEYSSKDFSYLFEKFISLLNDTIVTFSKKLTAGIDTKKLKMKWRTNYQTAMIGIKEEADFPEAFLNIITKQKDSFFSKYTKILPVPIRFQMHMGAYLDGDEEPARFFKNRFKKFPVFHDTNELNTKARLVRGKVVKQHWNFINQSGYLQSSGKAYIGLSYPGKNDLNSFIKKNMLLYQLGKF